nr:hypothetical protein [Nocardia xishanensis]
MSEHIANIGRRRHPADAVPESVQPIVARMGAAAIAMATTAAGVLDSGDPDVAAQLDGDDDMMDRLYHEVRRPRRAGRPTHHLHATGQSPDEWPAPGDK